MSFARAQRDVWAVEFAATARAYWTPERTAGLAHGKTLLLPPAEAAPLLRALGLLHRDASMPPTQHRKFFQINHMVALLGPALRELRTRHARIRLLDAGCGRSYLTLLLAWCARHVWAHPLQVLGVDRNPQVIDECRRRTALAELDDVVRFEAAPLEALDVRAAWARAFGDGDGDGDGNGDGDGDGDGDGNGNGNGNGNGDGDGNGNGNGNGDGDGNGNGNGDGDGDGDGDGNGPLIHGVVALHACDTATCDALVLGVQLGAELLAVAPCCQAELARAWSALADRGEAGAFAPIWHAPHLRRETAAHVTDAMRTLLLRAAGYEVWPIEFVPAEHTRKNTLIRAMKRGPDDARHRREYEALKQATGGVGLALEARLPHPGSG